MDLSKVSKVETLTDTAIVNAFLELGWQLISTYTTAYDSEPPRCYQQTQHFVLAWGDGEPKYPIEPEHGSIGLAL